MLVQIFDSGIWRPMAARFSHKYGSYKSPLWETRWTTWNTIGTVLDKQRDLPTRTKFDYITGECSDNPSMVVIWREGTNSGFTDDLYTLCTVRSGAISIKVHLMIYSPWLSQRAMDVEHDLTGDQIVATLGNTKSMVSLVETHPSIYKGMYRWFEAMGSSILKLCAFPPLLITTWGKRIQLKKLEEMGYTKLYSCAKKQP